MSDIIESENYKTYVKPGVKVLESNVRESQPMRFSKEEKVVEQEPMPIRTGFTFSTNPEPHITRRKKILNEYPAISLFPNYDILTSIPVIGSVLFQFFMGFYVLQKLNPSFPLLVFLTYAISGTINHSLFLAGHEISHNSIFPRKYHNRLLGIFACLPTGAPVFGPFCHYHAKHHTNLNTRDMDEDLPLEIEASMLSSTLGKFFWLFAQALFYALRPMINSPPKVTPLIVIGFITQVTFDIFVLYTKGWRTLFYFLGGSILGLGFHPLSGHFLTEHSERVPYQETYSYYGILNMITYNVGYHNEHHDFPWVPCRYLPMIKSIAPEFYNHPSYISWVGAIIDFLFSENWSQYNRVVKNPSIIINSSVENTTDIK